MTIANCISTFYFAEKYRCVELLTNSRKFIHDNFASVAELDEFLNLETKEIETWISSDTICIAAEEDVFKTILKWIEQNKREREGSLEKLFRHVRLVLISRDYLQVDVMTNELVRGNFSCLRSVLDAIALLNCASEDTFMQSPRRRLETHVILARGGKYTFCYLPEKDKWNRLADGLTEIRGLWITVTKFRDQLYIFSESSNAERYDPAFNIWASFLDINTPDDAKQISMALFRGQIYAIEISTVSNQSIIKRYNVELTSWQTVFTWQGCRVASCVVGAGDCLYVFGGRLLQSSEYVAIAERFDTIETKWEAITEMQQERGGAFGLATQRKIFVAGGIVGTKVLETCELYTASTNEWQFIASLNTPRCLGSMVCLNGTIYVLGGSRISPKKPAFSTATQSNEFTIESYEPSLNKWIQKTSIPVDRLFGANQWSFRGCVVKLSKGVLDKIVEI